MGFLTEHRKELFFQTIENRTRHLTVILEDIYQPHNASAVLRTCDCLGIQDVHIIENRNEYQVNPKVALGASKWLSMYKYKKEKDNILACIQHLKNQDYKIIATTPHKDDVTVNEFPIAEKTALGDF